MAEEKTCEHLQKVQDVLRENNIDVYHEDPGTNEALVCPEHNVMVWLDDLLREGAYIG